MKTCKILNFLDKQTDKAKQASAYILIEDSFRVNPVYWILKDIRVSILMPVYNSAAYLEEAIEGIMNQTYLFILLR